MEVREKFIARVLNNPDTLGFTDCKFIHSPQLCVAHWVRQRCLYTCHAARQSDVTPPFSPTPELTLKMLEEYKFGLILRREVPIPFPKDSQETWLEFEQGLVTAENEAFVRGYGKAFALAAGNCLFCHHDDSLRPCDYREKRRPTLEAIGINLQDTLAMIAWDHLLTRDPDDPFSMFGVLLLE